MLSTMSLIILGFVVGTFGTLVGIGGGIILIPIFLFIFHYSPQQAIGTSLAIVFFNSLSGTIAYIKQKKVFYNAGISFSLATIPGAIIGSYIADSLTAKSFYTIFSILLAITATIILYRNLKTTQQEVIIDKETFKYNRLLGIFSSFAVGLLSSILGIGGGIIHVPILIFLLGFPTSMATATSHFVLAISSFFGTASHYALGNVLISPALSIGFGAILGAQAGARLSSKLKSRPIQILLALSMLGLSVRLFFG